MDSLERGFDMEVVIYIKKLVFKVTMYIKKLVFKFFSHVNLNNCDAFYFRKTNYYVYLYKDTLSEEQ